MRYTRYVTITHSNALDLLQLISNSLDSIEDLADSLEDPSLLDDVYMQLRKVENKVSMLVGFRLYEV